MKKIISMFLIISIVASLVLVPVSGFAAKNKFLVAESYNDQPTGAVPLNGAIASGASRVKVTQDKKDKAVELSGKAGDSVIFYPVTTSEEIASMFVDLKYGDEISYTEFYVYDKDNKSFLLAYIDKNGTVCSGDTRLSTGFPKNRQTSVQITYNARRKKVSVFMGNKCICANRYLGDAAFDHIAGFGLKVKGETGKSCLLDNFAIFEGQDIIKSGDIPKKSFNSEAAVGVEVTSSGEAADADVFIGDAVYTNRTFDEEGIPEYEGLTVRPQTNKIETDASVFDGNKYLKIEKKDSSKESFFAFAGNQTARFLIVQADFSTEKNTPTGKLFYARDGKAASMFGTLLNYDTAGNVTTTTGVKVAKIEPLKWVNIAVALNFNDKTLRVLVDGKEVITDLPFHNQTLTGAPTIRINSDQKANSGTLLIDNLRAYEGIELRDVSKVERKTKKIPNSVPQGHLDINKAISPYSHTYYTDKTKYDAEHKMILENEDTLVYVHEDELKKMFGNSALLKNPHAIHTGYYDALETAKANGYLVTSKDTRLYIFSKAPVTLDDAKLMEVYRYLYNVRASAGELLELYKKSDNYQKHPRILIDQEELDRIKALYKTDPLMQEWGANVIKEADILMGEDDYTYRISGDSMDDVNYSMDDIVNLCLAYHLTGNERYVGRTWRFLKNICDLKNWNPRGYLDVGELSFITSIGYDWLYYQLTPEQRAYIEKNLYEKGTHLTWRLYHGELDGRTFVDNNGEIKEYYTGWYNSENNWNPVTNGGVMSGAMALLDVYPEIASQLIENATWALEYATPSYYPKGAWEEGGSYWNYALGYVVRTIKSFRNVFGTDFRISQAPGFNGTGWYGSKLSGSTASYIIGDTSSGTVLASPHTMWLANEFNDKELMAVRMQEFDSYGRVGGYNEMIYYNPDLIAGNVELPLDTFMEGMEVIALREAWYDRGATFVGASGGDNGRGHGHHDTGSFQIDMAGERFIRDVGAENYTAKGGYFTTNRYHFYRSRAEGHNMYIINPRIDDLDYYGVIKGSRAEGKLVLSKPRGAIATMDLSAVYGEWVSHAERGYMLSDDRRSVTVRDEIDLLEPDSEIYYSLHTSAKIEKLNDTQLVFTLNGKKMLISLVTNGTDVVFEEAEAQSISNVTNTVVKDSNNMSKGIRKAVIKMKGTGRVNITLKFKQYDDMMIADYPEDINIADWTIPDGEVTPLPVADAIYIDGKLVEDYDPKITGYRYLVASKETVIPTVTVASNFKTEIIPATEFDSDTIVKVYSPDNSNVYRTYRINFWKKPPLQDVDGMRRYPIAKVTCTDTYEEVSPPENTFDMDFGTRWAADSSLNPEQWIMFELDDIYPIERIGVAWMSGTARQYTYKLEISVDGKNWTTVFDGKSSGTNAKCEYLDIGGQMAKFVRYTGSGNTVNKWNSVTEVEILGNKR